MNELTEAVTRALLTTEPSLVIVDAPEFEASPGGVPVLVVDGNGEAHLISGVDGVADEIARRLAK